MLATSRRTAASLWSVLASIESAAPSESSDPSSESVSIEASNDERSER
jgi:hypothetical protein